MEKAIAQEVLQLLNEASGKFNSSIRVVLDGCPKEEFVQYREEVSKIMAEMFFNLMIPIHKAHPELEPEELKAARETTKRI